MTEPTRLWTSIIGIAGGLIAIVWNRALARRYCLWRYAEKEDRLAKAGIHNLKRNLRFGYIGIGVFGLINGLWALIRPWLVHSR